MLVSIELAATAAFQKTFPSDSLPSASFNLLTLSPVVFFPAGGDTTATALSALFFYLSRNAEAYSKLANEIRTTFASHAEIKGGPKLASCRYLRASIEEALRMSPPVSSV